MTEPVEGSVHSIRGTRRPLARRGREDSWKTWMQIASPERHRNLFAADRTRGSGRLASIRLPIAGPYRPRARLYLFPDGRLLWHVRLWEHDRPVAHLVRTDTLRTFALVNGLRTTLEEVDALDRRGRAESHRAAP